MQDPLPCMDDILLGEVESCDEKPPSLQLVTASAGAMDSTSPPRSPSGSSGHESCQLGRSMDAEKAMPLIQSHDGSGCRLKGRRGKVSMRPAQDVYHKLLCHLHGAGSLKS
jgi:hypothetical protein